MLLRILSSQPTLQNVVYRPPTLNPQCAPHLLQRGVEIKHRKTQRKLFNNFKLSPQITSVWAG